MVTCDAMPKVTSALVTEVNEAKYDRAKMQIEFMDLKKMRQSSNTNDTSSCDMSATVYHVGIDRKHVCLYIYISSLKKRAGIIDKFAFSSSSSSITAL